MRKSEGVARGYAILMRYSRGKLETSQHSTQIPKIARKKKKINLNFHATKLKTSI